MWGCGGRGGDGGRSHLLHKPSLASLDVVMLESSCLVFSTFNYVMLVTGKSSFFRVAEKTFNRTLAFNHSATACPRAALLLEGKISYSSVEEEGLSKNFVSQLLFRPLHK